MPLRHSTNWRKNPQIPEPHLRPRCQHRSCENPRAIIATLATGMPVYRKICHQHHRRKIARRYGVKSAAEVTAARQGMTLTEYSARSAKNSAEKQGYASVTEYKNSLHPYRRRRKDYCENRDGRLGFRCRYKIRHSAQLQVDHINGDPADNREENLQTLCGNCHTYKTFTSGDNLTPGRKTLRAL